MIKIEPNPKGICPYCHKPIRYTDAFCTGCGARNDSWRETSRSQCGNCHRALDPEDKYCKICGTKVGEGAYAPYQDLMECIYGPMPRERKHTCQKCGYSWTTCMMLDDQKYCPKCGGPAPSLPPLDEIAKIRRIIK